MNKRLQNKCLLKFHSPAVHYCRIFGFILILSACFISQLIAQGIINDNATIYMAGSSCIYINGSTGHYTNQNSGQITAGTTDTIKVIGNWYNNTNNRVFTSNGGVTSMQGASQTIGGSYGTSFYTLRLSGSGTKTLAQDVSVGGGYASPAGNLNLTSMPLDLNQHTLTITNPTGGDSTNGATRFSTGYAISEQNAATNNSIIKWQMGGASNTGTHLFPFGYTDGTQLPVRFNITSTSNADISISTRSNSNSCAPNPPGSCNQPWQSTVTQMTAQGTGTDVSVQSVIDRWWQIDVSAAATADLTLTYRGIENTTSFPSGLFKIQRWGGTGWNSPVGIGSTGATSGTGTATATGISSWGPIVITYAANPLPVAMLYALATCQKNSVLLNWATASETNASYFKIQKSYDGSNFIEIGQVKANGSSTNENKYEFSDYSVSENSTYYRIFETDFNGQKYFLNDISKTCNSTNNFNVTVYPNPVSGNNVSAQISGLNDNENYQVSLTESQGKLIWQSKMMTSDEKKEKNGAVKIRIASEITLSPGIYFLHTETERNSSNLKLIVK